MTGTEKKECEKSYPEDGSVKEERKCSTKEVIQIKKEKCDRINK